MGIKGMREGGLEVGCLLLTDGDIEARCIYERSRTQEF